MTALYLDAYSGISGDMLLGALVDLGANAEVLRRELRTLGLEGWELVAQPTVQQGISGTSLSVPVSAAQPVRHLSDILALIEQAELPDTARSHAAAVFRLLAEAEAKVHGSTTEEVHFHEVGGVDSILDIVGGCLALGQLGVERVYCSPLPLGSGFVQTQHGLLPVPAPATLELLAGCGAPTMPGRGEAEMVTPTGAAMVAHFAVFDLPEVIRPVRVGYGFGTRRMPWPNALRAVLLQPGPDRSEATDTVIELECNIDDMAGEQLAFALDRAMKSGALDAWWTPVGMKKGRPAVTLTVLADTSDAQRMAALLLRETSTLGVRYSERRRWKAGREMTTVSTAYGEVRVKLKLLDGQVVAAAPEYDDCARLAEQHGLAIQQVYNAARQAAGE